MAIESWSAPNQDPHTLAALSAGYQVNLAPIFSAIMEDRRRQQQQQQQQMSQMMSQIGSGVSQVAGAYGKSAQAGQADDAANRAIYMSQNPGSMQQLSSMGANQFDQSYVPDYGGTSGAQAYKFMQDQEKRDLQNALEQQKIDAIQRKLETPSATGGGASPQTFTDDQGREWRQGAGGHWYPMKSDGMSAHDQMMLEKQQGQLLDQSAAEKQANMAENKANVPFSKSNQLQSIQDRLTGSQGSRSGPNQSGVDQAMQAMGMGGGSQGGGSDAHAQAVKILQDNGKPVTDANVQYVMQQLVR